MKAKLLVWIVFWMFFVGLARAGFERGSDHLHTINSDGTRLPSQVCGKVVDAGGTYVVFADHYAKIASGNATVDAVAIGAYIATCQSDKVTVIIGSEFATHQGKAITHLVGFGEKPICSDKELHRLNNGTGTQQALIERLHKLGYLVVAVHPFKVGKTSNNLFDWNAAKGLDGMEVGNDGDAASRAKTMAKFHELLGQGYVLFVWAGNDSHTPADPEDKARWQRLTYVWVEGEVTAENIVAGFKAGRTYATTAGLEIASLNYPIGAAPTKVPSYPDFRFELKVDGPAPAVEIFRDGESVGKAVGWAVGSNRYAYRFRDSGRNIEGKRHLYTLEVTDELVTSPIVIDIPARGDIEPAIDGAKVRDRDGRNPGEAIFALSTGKGGELEGLIGDPAKSKALAKEAFQLPSEIRKVVDHLQEIGDLSACSTCGDVYEVSSTKLADVQIGRRDSRNQRRCATFNLILQDNRWRIRAAAEEYVNRTGLVPLKK